MATRTGERPDFDLAERTAAFAERVIRFARSVKCDHITRPLVSQLIRAATSIGANYCEAVEAGSTKEFVYRISVCKREARETQYWLRMLAVAEPDTQEPGRALWKEARELTLIFAAAFRKSLSNSKPRKSK